MCRQFVLGCLQQTAGNSIHSLLLAELNPHSTEPLEHGKVANHSAVIIAGVPCSYQRGHWALDELQCS